MTRRSAKQAPNSRRRENLDATDQLLVCCRNLQTLARLLEITAAETGAPWVAAALVADAGGMIADEVAQLRELLTPP